MEAKTIKHKYLRSKWTPIITECKNSGMTVRAWCRENDVNEKQFYYWQRRIREELYPTLLEKSAMDLTPTFVSVPREVIHNQPIGNSFNPDMIIDCGNFKMEISNSISPSLLCELIKAIHHA
jgi:putative transposase